MENVLIKKYTILRVTKEIKSLLLLHVGYQLKKTTMDWIRNDF